MTDSTDIVLQLHNVSAGYEKLTVLQQLDFAVPSGSMVGIIGPNGSGKSTLLKTLRGFLPALAGTVRLRGVPIGDLPVKEFACLVAYLQQHENLLPGYTVEDVVLTGRYPHLRWWQQESSRDRKIVAACMAYTGIADLAERDMLTLSGGQQQRVLLAKTLAQQTEILLLDEPAAGLDVFYQEEIFRLCRQLCAYGKTVLLVAHELPLAARFCTTLLLLGRGRLEALGSPQQVLTSEHLSRAYGVPISVQCNADTGHYDVYGEFQENKGKTELLRIIMDKNRRDLHA